MEPVLLIQDDVVLEIEETDEILGVEESVEILEFGIPGPQGPPASGSVDFEQSFPELNSWVVNHNLGKKPIAILLTPGGVEFDAEIIHTSVNQFVVMMEAPAAGYVRCI